MYYHTNTTKIDFEGEIDTLWHPYGHPVSREREERAVLLSVRTLDSDRAPRGAREPRHGSLRAVADESRHGGGGRAESVAVPAEERIVHGRRGYRLPPPAPRGRPPRTIGAP